MGVFLSANKKKRMQVFSELFEFNEQLLMNLKFAREPLSKIAGNFKFIPEVIEGKNILDGHDGEVISDYIYNLGKTDALSQIDYLNGKKAILAKYKEESFSDYKKYGSLYVKVAFMAGVLMAVLLA